MKQTPGKIDDPQMILSYVLGGNSTFTIRNAETGNRFTYRVRTAQEDRNENWSTNNQNRDLMFVSVLTGPDNNDSFQYVGMLVKKNNQLFEEYEAIHGKKSRIGPDAPSWRIFLRLMGMTRGEPGWKKSWEFWHEGSCCKCGRKLTVPESVAAGIGPECASKGE